MHIPLKQGDSRNKQGVLLKIGKPPHIPPKDVTKTCSLRCQSVGTTLISDDRMLVGAAKPWVEKNDIKTMTLEALISSDHH